MAEKELKTKTLINQRGSSFHVPVALVAGEVPEDLLLDEGRTVNWKHDSSITLSAENAAAYLDYPGVVDAAKYVRPGVAGEEIKALRKENAALKDLVKNLEDEIKKRDKKK